LKYAIVVPTCNSNDKCEGLLTNLLDSIVWGGYVDKGSPVVICWEPDCASIIQKFEQKYPFITSLKPGMSIIGPNGPVNLNFTKNANRGLRYVHKELPDCDGLICLNQDTVVPAAAHLEKIFNDGISNATGEHFDGSAWNKVQNLNNKNSPGCPCNKTIYQGKLEDSKKFACFCTWISRRALDTIGYFDDKTFVGSWEDDDYVVRALLAGLPCQVSPIRVHHELKGRDPNKGESISTTGSYSLNDLGISGYKFIQKWNLPFGLERHAEFADYILANWKGSPELKCE
jgi:hypothetical protein